MLSKGLKYLYLLASFLATLGIHSKEVIRNKKYFISEYSSQHYLKQ